MAVTCPYCRSIVEPRVSPTGQKICPVCNNTGRVASGGPAPAGIATGLPPAQPVAAPQRTADGAVASMVLGILSLVFPYVGWILAIIGLVLGNKAKRLIAQDPSLAGDGMAKAGRIMSIISIVLYGVALVVVVLVFALVILLGTTTGFNQTGLNQTGA